MTARIPETFQVQIFRLYFFPSSFDFVHSKSISFKFVSVLFCICLGSFFAFFAADESLLSELFDPFESVFGLFGAGSFVSFTCFLFEALFSSNFSVFLPGLALGESA